MDKDLLTIITKQLTSGRFLLTFFIGVVFVYTSISGILPVDKIMEVTLIVIYGYFTRERPKT